MGVPVAAVQDPTVGDQRTKSRARTGAAGADDMRMARPQISYSRSELSHSDSASHSGSAEEASRHHDRDESGSYSRSELSADGRRSRRQQKGKASRDADDDQPNDFERDSKDSQAESSEDDRNDVGRTRKRKSKRKQHQQRVPGNDGTGGISLMQGGTARSRYSAGAAGDAQTQRTDVDSLEDRLSWTSGTRYCCCSCAFFLCIGFTFIYPRLKLEVSSMFRAWCWCADIVDTAAWPVEPTRRRPVPALPKLRLPTSG